jgi:hypothetical protein
MLYFNLIDPLKTVDDKHEYLRNLNEYLVVARSESEQFHRRILEKRARENVDEDLIAEYQPGDFILFKPNPRSRVHKLMPTLLGPYRVKSQERGEIFCHQVATGVARQFHITRIYPFIGTDEEAFQLACRDSDQYGVKEILGYRGDPISARRYMTFLVSFADGDKSWVQYGPDIVSNTKFQEYVDKVPELMLLRYTSLEAGRYIARSKRLMIPSTIAPSKFLLDIRALGFTWYDSLQLPNCDTTLYVVEANFIEHSNKHKTRAKVFFPALDEELSDLDYTWFEMFATRIFLPDSAVLVDEEFLVKFPQVLGSSNDRQKQLERIYSPVIAGSPANRRGVYRSEKEQRNIKPNLIGDSRNTPRLQKDDHVPTVRDGNVIDGQRRILQRQLVKPITSRRFEKDIPEVNTGARTGLRRRNLHNI